MARKGKTVTHHFSHHGTVECNAETMLHKAAKRILAERVQAAIHSKTPLSFSWECPRCEDEHDGDLVRRATSLAIERAIGDRRPDITLLGPTGAPRVAIEIVVTHAPEPGARAFYREQDIPLVEFHVEEADDLTNLQTQAPLIAAFASYCPVPEWQLREINFLGATIRLQHLIMQTTGDVLRLRTPWPQEEAPAPSLDVWFRFTSPRAASDALIGLKEGRLDGLYGLDSPPHPRRIEEIGLQEACWFAHGYDYLWQRGVGIIRLYRGRRPVWAR